MNCIRAGGIFGLNNANGGTKRFTKDFLIKNQGILSWKMMDMHLIAASFLGGSEELDGCITPTVHGCHPFSAPWFGKRLDHATGTRFGLVKTTDFFGMPGSFQNEQ